MTEQRAIAIVGLGAILPDAPNAPTYWQNIKNKRYSIQETPPERWSIADYYDPDPLAPDKTYSKIGGWVRGFEFDWKRFRIPPKVAEAMDASQQWAVTIAAEALADYGYPDRPLNTERTGVILGTAMGGERHYETNLRISFPEYANLLDEVSEFQQLPASVRAAILAQWQERAAAHFPEVTEDTMPGELPNIVSGRVANVLNLRGPNFIADAACASSFAAINAAVELLTEGHCDAVLTGGVDRNMGAGVFIKFCKIGALSATGSRPFGDGADGFVMGEGSASFLLRRLADAEADGDKIYAVIRGVGGSSDGKGKGITAPNPIGQVLAARRAWENAGLDPATAMLVEAHGTSTRVGDVVEVESLSEVFGAAARGRIAIGSAKSNIGHLKAGAGAAGLLKAVMAVSDKLLPPTLHAETPNPNIDFGRTPFYVNHELREWTSPNGDPRRAGVSAYGFGGTNFHVVIEEHVPGLLRSNDAKQFASVGIPKPATASSKPPVRGILALGASTPVGLKDALDAAFEKVQGGWTPPIRKPDAAALAAPERLVIDFGERDELLERIQKARKVMGFDNPNAWKAMQAQGIFRGSGSAPGKIAFLFPGQGSQYVNMGRELAAIQPIVAQTLAEADRVMTPILGKPLSDYLFVDPDDAAAVQQANFDLMQTAITQPAMLTLDTAIYGLLGEYGFHPDMVMGHSLGEYAALIAAGIMQFDDALEASAARGREMTAINNLEDTGWMAAVIGPLDVILATLEEIDGYVIPANINSTGQVVIGGASKAVEQAIAVFNQKGLQAMRIPVSHAFHTKIVAPASKPLRQVLDRLDIREPQLPLVANVSGELYPTTVEAIKDTLEEQVAATVQWVKGLETLYREGCRTFVEVGPKRALSSFAADVLGSDPAVITLFTNHPKWGELPTFNQALCGLYAAGYGAIESQTLQIEMPAPVALPPQQTTAAAPTPTIDMQALAQAISNIQYPMQPKAYDRNHVPLGSVIISGTGLGLPGAEKPVMDPDNALRILHGEQFIDLIPERFRQKMVEKRITRVVKAADGGGSFETITDPHEVIKLAGRPGSFDLEAEYGVPAKLIEALDTTTQLAMAAGLDALREAGIPLVQTYRHTTKGTFLPEKWMLPPALRDETGVIFASAFPGGDRFVDELARYYEWVSKTEQLATLDDLRRYATDQGTLQEINRRIGQLREAMERAPYTFDRRFIFRILAMGHSQFAEYIGARGPNTHVNAACASTAQGVALAEDWIRSGRCRRVIVLGADNVTGDTLLEWIGAGFLSVGAAATDDSVAEAALPFDARRHGTILGMGACALVVESEDAVRERGMRGIVELLSSETSNSAYHGTRLDVDHINLIMENLVTAAERRFGLNRYAMAQQMVFMSHETFTPARGGSASAEVMALRNTFGEAANDIVVANTKGYTGHPMGVGVEDVIAIKCLEYGIVPPVPNFKEVDPGLGVLNLSRGGRYPVQFALHLAAGFGSQIAFTLTRRIPGGLDRIDHKPQYARWLADVSGYDQAETEVVKRVLRIKAQGSPGRTPIASPWRYGTGPTVRANTGGDGSGALARPAPMAEVAELLGRGVVASSQRAVISEQAEVGERRPGVRVQPVAVSSQPEVVSEQLAADSGQQAAGSGQPSTTGQPTSDFRPPTSDPIAPQVLAIVAEKTGYPEDMLDLDLDLEADLGIDTVKQAETFAAVREAFGIPQQENLSLRDYPTLEHVIGYVRSQRPDLAADSGQQEAGSGQPSTTGQPTSDLRHPTSDPIAPQVLAIVAEKTGYPEDMLDLDLDLEADLGIDTVKQAETFAAVREAFDIPQQENLSLRDYPTLEHVIGYVRSQRPDLKAGGGQQAAGSGQPSTTGQPTSDLRHPTSDPIAPQVLAIVAEKTGYPEDMLDLDLDLEADLGIDTVKQAETFAAIRQEFDIPLQENLQLRDYPTLAAVIGFVHTMRPDLAAGGGQQEAGSGQPSTTGQPTSDLRPPTSDPVTPQVLAIVAEKTGYPEDMLDLDLDLEADLGIDTVKQAETFAAIRQEFDIPLQENLQLRDYPTLAAVIGFVHTMRPDLTKVGEQRSEDGGQRSVVSKQSAVGSEQYPVPNIQYPTYDTADADKMPRRVPVPSLRPGLDLCKPTGVSLTADSRVFVMMDRGGVGKSLAGRLQKLGVTVLALDADVDTAEMVAQLQAWQSEAPIQGVYWLPALDVEPDLQDLDLAAWRELNRQRAKNLYATMRTLYDSVAGANTFLISATRLGGMHGYGPDAATAPMGGAVTGFTKAYNIERNMSEAGRGVLVKAVDFEVSRKTAEPADLLIAETLSDPAVVEVGHHNGLRYAITLVEKPAADGNPGLELRPDSVFVVTGAAGGITSAIVTDLAQASRGIFYLLDLVPAPSRDDPGVLLYRADVDALKRKLIEEARDRGERPTPVIIDKQVMAIERSEAALRAVEAVEAAGGTAHYHAVDLMDGAAVAAVIDDVRQRYGKIDVLLHAGGLLIDRTLPNKEPNQFALVFDVKADGFFSLMKAAQGLPIAATVAFSSVAGRFGNNGQSDYSSANDLLCKIASSMRSWRPETRAIAIDWTAWGEIGMAARGSVPTVMAALGVDMLPPESGIPTIRRELTYGGTRGEIVVAGRLGAWLEERDPTGGLDSAKMVERVAARNLLMVGEVKAARLFGGIEIETILQPNEQPFLFDHAPDEGTPWLPGVMATESLAEVAAILTPDYHVVAVENEEMLGAFKFFRMEPRTLYLSATISPAANGDLIAHTLLRSITQPKHEELPAQVKEHFTADVRLSRSPAVTPTCDFTSPAALPINAETIYESFFHGPAYHVIERAQTTEDSAIGLFNANLPANTSPADAESLMAPRLVELCFQLAALWHSQTKGQMAFPLGFERLIAYRQEADATGPLYGIVVTTDGGETFDCQIVDEKGDLFVELQGYRTVSRPA